MANHEIPIIYKMEPLYESEHHIPLPSCMYKMKSIYSTRESDYLEVEQDSSFEEIENHLLQVLKKLEDLKNNVLRFKKELKVVQSSNCTAAAIKPNKFNIKVPKNYQDIVVKANPQHPPLSLWVFYNLLTEKTPVQLATFIHSSLFNVPELVHELHQAKDGLDTYTMTFTVIWKEMGKDAEMMIDPINQGIIEGEVNIVRYISRLLCLGYDNDVFEAAEIDYWLQLIHSMLIHGQNKERNIALKSLNSQLGKSSFLGGIDVSVADIVLWSAIIQCSLQQSLPNNIVTWWKLVNNLPMFQTPLKHNSLRL